MHYKLRPIVPEDNPAVADIIKTVMTAYGAVGKGYGCCRSLTIIIND
jgi:hypothetical protein